MKLLLLFTLLLAAAFPAAANVTVNIRNRRPPAGAPAGGGTATAGQFSSAAFTNGGLNRQAANSSSSTVAFPTTAAPAGHRLRQVIMGASFAVGVPDHGFGEVIAPPSPPDEVPVGGWRGQPLVPGESVTTSAGTQTPVPAGTVQNFYYSPHSDLVYASRPGIVTIFWRSALPAPGTGLHTVERRDHLVSIVPRQPARRMFWTESPQFGPSVQMPPTVQAVYIDYRTGQFPATSGGGTENRTLWLDDQVAGKSLRAQRREGRIFIEFLGQVVDAISGRREHLGTEVVDVSSEPVPGITSFSVQSWLGNPIVPSDGDATLAAQILNGTGVTPPFIANRPVNNAPVYFAERVTQTPGDVVVFWKEPSPIGIYWPRMRNQYELVWPDEAEAGAFAINTLPDAGDGLLTSVDLFNENSPILIHQDNSQSEAAVSAGRFRVQPGADGENRSLLLLQSGGRFWYVRVYSATQSRIAALPPALQTTYSSIVGIGERIAPPVNRGDNLSRAGHIHTAAGTAFHPAAYVDPMTAGFGEAELRSEIIPVNSLPGNDQLKVWWYRRITPPAGGFLPLYWPSVIGTYTLQWPGAQVASQVSTFSALYPASSAVDGIIAANNFSHTASTTVNPSWKLDFNETRLITAVTIHNRVEGLQGRLRDITVEVLGGDGEVLWASDLLNPENAGYVFPAGPATLTVEQIDTFGRALRIRRTSDPDLSGGGSAGADANVLCLAEVVVTSQPCTREIIMASNAGTGALTPAESTGSIYFQNDPALPGYNPNEEHALMLGGQGYALRDDLNVTGVSSPPFVLVDYSNENDGRRALSVFRVLREKGTVTFDYEATAGTQLQGPMPLPLLPLPLVNDKSRNTEVTLAGVQDPDSSTATPEYYDGFTFEDRKGTKWVYRGTHGNNAAARLLMQYYYPTQAGFAFPDAVTGENEAPAAGSIQPYLRTWNGSAWTSTPETISYIPRWPDQLTEPQPVPVLNFAETLTNAKNGLPAMRGQTSAQILYEQSRATHATGSRTSVVLMDATRAKTFAIGTGSPALNGLPGSIATDSRNGKTYFQNLPPHLKERFYFNPLLGSKGALVLEGKFVDDVVGEDYLLLNVLSAEDLAAIQALVPSSDTAKAAWDSAATKLKTTVETFEESITVPGTWVPGTSTVTYDSDQLPIITSPDQAVDSYALTTRGTGSGYVTLVFGDGEAFTPEGEPVSLSIIRVGPELHTGQMKVLASANPLDEKVTLRHSADFSGQPENFEFEWRYAPPANGMVPDMTNPGLTWIEPATGLGSSYIVGGSGILALSDNYWIMRYKPIASGHPRRGIWSPWTQPALVEGWIKRALAGINPFNQRVTDFFNNGVNTDVSILTQAGRRWEGNIALNLANINEFGLIEIYETILQRGLGLSINGTPPIDYGPANDALLLAGGYLADLYTILGDEATADAANPTIAFDAQAIGSVADSSVAVDFTSAFQQTATARFAFQGQVGNLLEEELALLRGRDDVNSPGVELAPSYNRLFWNYTRGITAGEVIYALNYNIRERQAGSADGRIDATDASRMFPQAHGDAYGHYLTAAKNYYRLLTDPQFTWAPRVEAVNILGVPVQVDYLDERKFASAASRTAKAAKQIAGLVHRQAYSADTAGGWQHFRDGSNPAVNYRDGKATSAKRTRHWGLDEWHARGVQGAYFNWVVANSILPASSSAPGIQKIDRTTVPELEELALIAADMQHTADSANARLNPLGLEAGSTLFDISPTEKAAGKTHFEQIYERAVRSLGNAFDTFDQATASTRLLRSLENQSDDLSAAVYDQENAYNLQLIELYGTPYAGDIGPGKTYAQGYAGPDLFNFFYVDQATILTDGFNGGEPLKVNLHLPIWNHATRNFVPSNPRELETFSTLRKRTQAEEAMESPPINTYTVATYSIQPESLAQYAAPAMGQRQRPGRIQTALQTLGARRESLIAAISDYQRADQIFKQRLETFNAQIKGLLDQQTINAASAERIREIQKIALAYRTISRAYQLESTVMEALATATSDGFPTAIGTSTDPSFAARFGVGIAFVAGITVTNLGSHVSEALADYQELEIEYEANDLGRRLDEAMFPSEMVRMGAELDEALYAWWGATSAIDQAMVSVQQSRMELAGLLHEGQSIQQSRETFRKRAAVITQGYRTRDVAFRAFRTESLEQYQTLLDWAARYAFLAAKAYDYETGLLGTPQGQAFLNDIVGSRALGLRNAAGQPIFGASSTGDPGISGLLAKLNGDWSSVRTRLGFNNPDTYGTVFSFRRENYRIPGDTAPTDSDTDANNDSQDDKTWKEQMQSLIVSDIRTDADVATHCLQLGSATAPVPGFIIPFSTMVQDGYNFFGQPLAAGDSTFSSSSFATKIHSVGIVFDGYVGMNAYATGSPTAAGPASNAPNALSATPYLYLIPTGMDVMRTPPLGDTSVTREYDIQDYALPLPFNIGDSQFSNVSFWTGNDTLTEDFLTPRKHQAFRAVEHPFYFFMPLTADFTSRRLVGRSVWNTGWKLVIPANTLLNNTSDGLSRFLKSVRDIKLYVRSYSYSGN